MICKCPANTGLTVDCSSSSPFGRISHLTSIWEGVFWLAAKAVNTVLRTLFIFISLSRQWKKLLKM